MSKEMAGKVAIVTGAGMGIGRAVALEFAQEGVLALLGRGLQHYRHWDAYRWWGIGCLVPIHKWHLWAPGGVSRFVEILKIAHYSRGFKNALALPGTKVYHFWMDTV
jgi:hypothetical protein